MIVVGDRKIFLCINIFVPKDEEAVFELVPDKSEDPLILKIRFELNDEPKDSNGASFYVTAEDSVGVLTFKNWVDLHGASISNPSLIATTDTGRQVTFLGNIVKLGDIYKVELQFMLGGDKDD